MRIKGVVGTLLAQMLGKQLSSWPCDSPPPSADDSVCSICVVGLPSPSWPQLVEKLLAQQGFEPQAGEKAISIS